MDYPEEIRRRSCPTCKADSGEACRSKSGIPLSAAPHAARRDAAFPVLTELGSGYIGSHTRSVLLRHNIGALKDLEPVLREEGVKGLRYFLLDMRGMGERFAEHVIQTLVAQGEVSRSELMDADA
ncbi:hypothetical protein [Streptomyces sp. 5-10]|uniref:zinc finger domain-containing protein n=1 Tax=Streptomyces sp. 5-10 TaxID=878925 RepID=UPI00168A79C4|nr:hypothetical protein [Streptomyces sp. 5-10]MBD3004794.1 hypothetical protein [Streptomyces sp. 5-10]